MLKVFIDGNRYQEAYIEVKKSFLLMSHYFEVNFPLYEKIPFNIGSEVIIKNDNKKILTGQIEEIYIYNRTIIIRGQSFSASKLNSYPSSPINLNNSLTLDQIIYQCIGIKPIVNTVTEPFAKEELIIDDNCETYSKYFSKLASKRAVYIIENENGNLVITRNNETDIIGSLGDNVNILESQFYFNVNELYENITLYAQSNLNSYIQDNTNIPIEKISGFKVTAKDPVIRDGRTFYVNLCYGISEPNLKNLANFQIGLQRAKAMKYKIKYPFFLLDNNVPADIGKLIKVSNGFDNIKGTFFIEDLVLKSGSKNGKESQNYSEITLTYMNAYKLNFSLGNNTNLGGFINV